MIYFFRNKNYMGGFTMKNVQSLSKEELVLVVGGYTAKQCLQAIGSWGILLVQEQEQQEVLLELS